MVPTEVSLACCPGEAASRDVLLPVRALPSQTCFPACPQVGTLDSLAELLEELASNKGMCGDVNVPCVGRDYTLKPLVLLTRKANAFVTDHA